MFLSERMGKKTPNITSPTVSKRFLHTSSTSKVNLKEANAERGVVLTRVLQDDSMRESLQAKLDKNHTGEGLAFVTAVENVQGLKTNAAIMEEFILDSAPAQINLTHDSRTKLIKSFRRQGSSFESPNIFDDAYDEVIFDIQHSDVFAIFIRKEEKDIKELVDRLQSTSIGVAL